MVNVTPDALTMLDEMLGSIRAQIPDTPEGQADPALRLVVEPGALGLELDLPSPDDQVVERDGHQVLLIGNEISTLLDGATIDAVETPEGTRLAVRGLQTEERNGHEAA